MDLYIVELITDLDEQVSICVQANDQYEAEAIAVSMLENGEHDCVGRNEREILYHLFWMRKAEVRRRISP